MERLTIRSENSNAHLEPCEMTAHHNRMALDKFATYEDSDEQGLLLRLPCNRWKILVNQGKSRSRAGKMKES